MGKLKILLLAVSVLFLAGCKTNQEPLPTGVDAIWNLVIIGDSSLWKLGEAYAAQIEEDVGIQVKLDDFSLGNMSAGKILDVLRGGETSNSRLQELPEAIKNAEVIVMFLNPTDSIDPDNPLDMEGCFASVRPRSCAPDTFTTYTEDLKSVWEEIFQLRKGKATILRATDLYNPLVSIWQENGVLDACNECWHNVSQAHRTAAEIYGIPFLSRWDAINGLDHVEDPRLKGFIDEDGEHPTTLMAEYVADLLGAMGYEPVSPP